MAFSLKINTVDRSSYVDKKSLSIEMNLNDEVDNVKFDLIIKASDLATIKPALYSTVDIYDGISKIFGGIISRLEETELSFDTFKIGVDVLDFSYLMTNRLVTDSFESKPAIYILNNLINDYANDTDYTIIEAMESGWTGSLNDTANYVEGTKSQQITNSTCYKDVTLDLTTFISGITSTDSDYIDFFLYVEDKFNLTSVEFKLGNTALTSYYSTTQTIFINGWNYFHILKSDFTATGTPDWATIQRISFTSSGTSDVSIDDLRLISADSFSKAGIEKTTTIIEYIGWNYIPLKDAISELAKMLGYYWYVDQNKVINFFSFGYSIAPYDVTDSNGVMTKNSLILTSEADTIKNRVYVRGSEYLANALTDERQVADGEATNWKIGNPGATMSVYVDSGAGFVLQTLGTEYLDSDDGTYDFFWNNSEKYIRQKDGATALTSGYILKFTYYPYIPIIVYGEDSSSIATYGLHEMAIIDTSIKTKDGARQRALAEILAYKDKLEDGKFTSNTAGFNVGQRITLDSTKRALNKNYIIKSISAYIRTNDELQYSIVLVATRKIELVNTLISLLLQQSKTIAATENQILEKVKYHLEDITIDELHTLATDTEIFKTYGPDISEGQYGLTQYSGSSPIVDFSGTPLTGDAPLTVTFTDLTINSPTTWSWTFGDGGVSALQNPSHEYLTAGTYTVALTATNIYGSDSETKVAYITVTTAPTIGRRLLEGGGFRLLETGGKRLLET